MRDMHSSARRVLMSVERRLRMMLMYMRQLVVWASVGGGMVRHGSSSGQSRVQHECVLARPYASAHGKD